MVKRDKHAERKTTGPVVLDEISRRVALKLTGIAIKEKVEHESKMFAENPIHKR